MDPISFEWKYYDNRIVVRRTKEWRVERILSKWEITLS